MTETDKPPIDPPPYCETLGSTSSTAAEPLPAEPPPYSIQAEPVKLRKWPQANSMGVELFLLFGSSFATSMLFYNENESYYASPALFFLAIGVGALCHRGLRYWTPRRSYRQTEITFFYLGAVIFMLWPGDVKALVYARFFTGFGTGLCYAELLNKMGEIASAQHRGRVVSCVGVIHVGMMLLGAAMMRHDNHRAMPDMASRSSGVIIFLVAFVAQFWVFNFKIESPIYWLQEGKVTEAIQSLMQFRQKNQEVDVLEEVKDLQDMLIEDQVLNHKIFSEGNSKPMILVVMTRVISALMFNYPFTILRASIVSYWFSEEYDYYAFGLVAIPSIRLLATLVPTLILDTFGRRKTFICSATLCGTIAIAMGIFLYIKANLGLITIACVAFELLSGIAFPAVSDLYTAEAFPIVKKANAIGYAIAIEQCLQAAMVVPFVLWRDSTSIPIFDFWYVPLVCGNVILAVGVFSWKILPETNRLSLRNARRLFKT